jgi:osmotically-inducible protein OsmY
MIQTLCRPRRAAVTAAAAAMLLLPLCGGAQEPMSDGAISLAVTERIFDDAAVEDALIDVAVDEGLVTLTGQVTNLMAKERAQRLAETVKGVRAVINRLEVSPTARTDDALEADIVAALVADPVTETDDIQVSVKDQEVTLTGTVESWGERTLAGRVAKQVNGVKDLKNSIAVRTAVARPDDEIETEVEEILAWDVLVDDGEVRLTGTVDSWVEWQTAAENAYEGGAARVDNDLRVRYGPDYYAPEEE